MTAHDWSVPETEVLASIRGHLDAGRDAVLATIVGVEGSAYRRPGAKMVIEEGGAGVGSITAGCLEDEVLALASRIIADGTPRVETYDLMEDDGDVWGLGVGCNGVIDILLEPLDVSYRPAIETIDAGDRIGVVTVLSGDAPVGSRSYYRPETGIDSGDGFPGWLAKAVTEPARELTAAGDSDTVQVDSDDGSAEVFIDGLEPSPDLIVVGSGHDVGPVVDLAKKNDFRVTVVGFRGAAALEERFPDADETIATSPTAVADAVDVDERTYAVLMTHNFIDDRLALDEFVQTQIPYVGLMGPRKRFDEMREEFDAEGRTFSDAELSKIFTPIGVDLGGGSPYGIATSIVAEALAVHNDRTPKHLKDREGPIHDRTIIESADATVSD